MSPIFRRRVAKLPQTPTMVPGGPYTQWLWPRPPDHADGTSGFDDFAHDLTPEVDPGPNSCLFWAHQFRTIAGEGGYVGLQTWGNRADGSLGKMAIFSFWDALEGRGPGVVPFSGEGSGWSCRIPLAWKAGQGYRLSVAMAADGDGDSRWWVAAVDGSEFGRIRVPARWGRLRPWSIMWTEYYGPRVARCDDLPYARAVFSVPVADGGLVRPRQHQSHIGEGDCVATRITDVHGGVRQEMGIPSDRATPPG